MAERKKKKVPMVCLALLLLAAISVRWFVVVPCCVAEENDNV